MEKQKPLRTCKQCGLQAFNETDLELFVKDKKQPHGRRILCKSCYNPMFRKGGSKWSQERADRIKRWHEEHPERIKEMSQKRKLRRLTMPNSRITLKNNPRRNICSKCGRTYPDELNEQTIMHHEEYDVNDPLAHTIELCRSCHNSLHRKKEIENGTFSNFKHRR